METSSVDGGRHRRVGHDVGEGRGDHVATQQDHAGAIPHHLQHLVGQAPGEAGLCENHADHNGSENEEHGRIHEVLEGHLGRPHQEKYLESPDEQAGDADGHHLEDPPGAGPQEDGDGRLAFPGKREVLAHGIHRIGPGRGQIDQHEEKNTSEHEGEPLPVQTALSLDGDIVHGGSSGLCATLG